MNRYAELLEKIAAFEVMAKAEKTWGPYTRQDGRQIIIVQDEDGKKRTISYPKYLVEKHLGHSIGDLTVDHWDSNKDNNSLDNLKVIDRKEHSTNDTRRVKLVDLKCVECNNIFQRSPRLIRDKAQKGCAGPFCNGSCRSKFFRRLQLNNKKNNDIPLQQPIKSEYYKLKYE